MANSTDQMNRHQIQKVCRRVALWLAVAALSSAVVPAASAQTRIKDIVDFEGVRDNLLVGYGLVVGLSGSGDTLDNAPFTQQSLIGMLERLGVNTRDELANLKTKNIAAVMVTATLPPFSGQGKRIDVAVSALGDAKSLLGGTLLVTPMLGADGEVYAVSQGQIVVNGFTASGDGQTIVKGVPTAGRLPNGAIVERELGFDLDSLTRVRLNLRNPDFTTARRIAQSINALIGGSGAAAVNPATVEVPVPANRVGNVVGLMTDIEQLRVTPDQLARVVIDEQSGVIVMGENVRLSTVAVAQGNLTIRITETPQVSQPNAFSDAGTTTVVPRTDIEVEEDDGERLAIVPAGVTLQELVDGLNALGIGPRDMIAILQTVKAAGALQAELEVM